MTTNAGETSGADDSESLACASLALYSFAKTICDAFESTDALAQVGFDLGVFPEDARPSVTITVLRSALGVEDCMSALGAAGRSVASLDFHAGELT